MSINQPSSIELRLYIVSRVLSKISSRRRSCAQEVMPPPPCARGICRPLPPCRRPDIPGGTEGSDDQRCAEFERFATYKSNWKTTTFKKVCTGLGYRINPDREGNRWLKSINGENKDFYQLVPQEGAMKGVLSTDAEEAAPEPPAPPVVENGRFSGFFFGDDLQEDDK